MAGTYRDRRQNETGTHTTLKRSVGLKKARPAWVDNKQKLSELINQFFPQQKSNPGQHHAALRWMRIIHYYWLNGWTRRDIAKQFQMTIDQVHNLLRRISRAAQGRRADGRGLLRTRPVGRPRKIQF